MRVFVLSTQCLDSPWHLMAIQSVFIDLLSPSFHKSLTRLLKSNKQDLAYLYQEIGTFLVSRFMLLPSRDQVLLFFVS